MIPKTTIYYGKKYGLVYVSKSRKDTDIYSYVLNTIFGDYSKGELRKKLQSIKNLIFIDHLEINGKEFHATYVKQPYDKLVRKA